MSDEPPDDDIPKTNGPANKSGSVDGESRPETLPETLADRVEAAVSDAVAGLTASAREQGAGLRVVGGTEARAEDVSDESPRGRSAGHSGGGNDQTPDQRRALLDTTDLGMATRLADYFDGTLLFCASLGWLRFDGLRFDAEEGEALAHQAVLNVRDRMKAREYPALKDWFKPVLESDNPDDGTACKRAQDQMARLWKGAVQLGNHAKQVSALKQASVLAPFRIKFDALDADPGRFNTPAGVLTFPLTSPVTEAEPEPDPMDTVADLTCAPPVPADRITRISTARPNLTGVLADDYDCPRWRAHIKEVFPSDPDKQRLFQRVCGSMLVSHNPRQHWFIFQGEGGDGKSVTMSVIQYVLGDYFRTGSTDTILYNPRSVAGGTREDLMRLAGGNRVVLFPEPNHKDILDGTMLKAVTGGEEVSARGGYGKQTEFHPQFKMVMMCNPRPKVMGDDRGFWRRVIFIRFPHRFTDSEIDTDILPKLKTEADGILNWMIEGFADWRARGFDFAPPENVVADINAWRRESSQFAAWAQDRIIWGRWWDRAALREGAASQIWVKIQTGTASPEEEAYARREFTTDNPERHAPERYLPRDDIYEDFIAWCEENGMDPWRPNAFSREFAAKARAHGAKEAARSGAKGRGWTHFDFVTGAPMRRKTGDLYDA